MITELLRKQQRFALCMAKLIVWINERGWAVTLGEGYDDDNQGHMKGSLHYLKLAQDLNLFVEDVYQTGECAAWHEIGDYWKILDEEAAWGGDFASRDWNHFSIRHMGRA